MPFEMAFDPEIADQIRRWRAEVTGPPAAPIPVFLEGVQVGHVAHGEMDAEGNLVLTCTLYPAPGPYVPIEGRA